MNSENVNEENLPATPVDPLTMLRQVAAAEGAGATLLKFAKGHWKAGPDEEQSPFGPLVAGAERYLATKEKGDPIKGYYFRIFLPQRDGLGIAEGDEGHRAGDVDPVLAETTWCAYAWPVERDVTGRRTFFVNQAGDVLATSDGGYSGERGPEAYAAFDPSSHSYGITGKTALDKVGNDRATWSPAN